MGETWDDLTFWDSPEWTKIQEQLDDLDQQGISYNPDRAKLFAALDSTPLETCKVAILGQDPYPQAKFATGTAFSIPRDCDTWPSSLAQIMGEYTRDLSLPPPAHPMLDKWTSQGVLLWNVIPTCLTGVSLSHYNWDWNWLTMEIIEKLDNKPQGCVFALLGAVAREYEQYIDHESCHVIWTSHPSPRGNANSFNPFKGSRLFSRINDCLVDLKYSPIDWKL